MVRFMYSIYGKMLCIFFKSLDFFFLVGSKNFHRFLLKKRKVTKERECPVMINIHHVLQVCLAFTVTFFITLVVYFNLTSILFWRL